MPMSMSQIASVALVLAVVYYILALMVSGITKWFLDTMDTRGKTLEDALKKNLLTAAAEAKGFTLEKLKQNPQIDALRPLRYKLFGLGIFTKSTEVSKYIERISPQTLVDALFDLEGTAKNQKEKIKNVIEMLPCEFTDLSGKKIEFQARTNLLRMADKEFYTFDQWRGKLENLVTGIMEQGAQKFRARAQQIVILLSFALVFFLGVDTIDIAQRAWVDASLTKAADNYAQVIVQSPNGDNVKKADLGELYSQLGTIQVIQLPWYTYADQEKKVITNTPWFIKPKLPTDSTYNAVLSPYVKWSLALNDGLWLLLKILGLTISAIAVSQGSSFWYDIIRQIKGDQKTASGKSEMEENKTPSAPSMAPGFYGQPVPPTGDH